MKTKLPNINAKIQRVKTARESFNKSRIKDLHNFNRSSFLNLDSTGFRIRQTHVNESPMQARLNKTKSLFENNREQITEGFTRTVNETFLCSSTNLEYFYK